MALDLFIIDGIGPFFISRPPGTETNWSKAPFGLLEAGAGPDDELTGRIAEAFSAYAARVARLGYNAITIDDLAHMVCHDFYPENLRAMLARFRALYNRIIAAAVSLRLRVLVTTDVMYLNEAIARHTGRRRRALLALLERSIELLFEEYPGVAGVILRLGEADGVDVRGEFHSALTVRTPGQLRRLLGRLVPQAERHGRLLIVRTWTLGAFPVGDLAWNPRTYRRVFEGFDNPHLAVSHKFGETDFFRFLNLNPLFHSSVVQTIVELQARREYEGFGAFPSYVGFDYERYARYLSSNSCLIGICVWCQTGGWSHFDDLTFVRNSSMWTELNCAAAVGIFRHRLTAEQAAERFARSRFPAAPPDLLVDLLRLSERVMRDLWYLPEFSSKRLYFRRTRVPPLIWVLWDNILVNHTLRTVLRRFVHERREAIVDGYRALDKIHIMRRLGGLLGIASRDFDFQYNTFEILAAAREYFLGPASQEIVARITELARRYAVNHPGGFHICADFAPVRPKKRLVKVIFGACLRPHPHYRLIDRLLLNRFAALVYPLVDRWQRARLPAFAREQAMGIGVLFK